MVVSKIQLKDLFLFLHFCIIEQTFAKSQHMGMPTNDWKQKLTPEQHHVLREKGTEDPFSGEYVQHDEEGLYRCIGCGAVLFASQDKFDSGSGWPSFDRVVESNAVELYEDVSHNMRRMEVKCRVCYGHLGHVFPDGPTSTGKRYCINSCVLTFQKLDE